MSLVSLVVIRQSLQLLPLEQLTLQGLRLQQCFLPQYVTGQSGRNQADSTASSFRAAYTTRSTTVAVFPPSVCHWSVWSSSGSLQLRPLEQSTLQGLRLQQCFLPQSVTGQCFLPQYVTGQSCRHQSLQLLPLEQSTLQSLQLLPLEQSTLQGLRL